MIVGKKINIKIKNQIQINSIKKMGYTGELKINNEIQLPIKYLSYNSHVIVNVMCDNCHEEKQIKYQSYNKSTKNNTQPYYCNNKECINKIRQISINEKYGVDNVFQLKDIKNQIEETNLEKFGFKNPQQNNQIKKKTEETNLERYGAKNPFQSNEIKEKIKKTNLERYGVEYPQQSKEIRSKYSSLHKPSQKEKDLLEIIRNNYSGEIITSSKNIIVGFELDIYLPELKLAFEFNGLYWHNELNKKPNYHKTKTDLCNDLGIQLIHVYEDNWDYKQEIVKSMVLNKLNKLTRKVYARKTIVKEITDNKIVRDFLDNNHIQGFVGSKIKIGLFHDDELLSIMTFGRLRKIMNSESSNENEYEMLRFCNKLNTSVIGGASKLFKFFVRNYQPDKVISYADRSHSNGNLYNKLGFDFISETTPNYYYVVGRKRKYRFRYRKDILVKDGYDSTKTEHQIMLDRKIYRIYDSGNIKFEYNQ